MSDDINLEQWIVLERLRLDEFAAYWRSGAAGNNANDLPADAFPASMPAGDWDEQYRCFGGG